MSTHVASPEKSMPEPLLRLVGISKRFGTVEALKDVSFEVFPGEVVALLGDNGAGKSTLVKIISGTLEADSGQLYFAGQLRKHSSPAEVKAQGIETVYQDLSLCLNMDVVANFFMGRERYNTIFGFRVLREAEMEVETKKALDDIGTTIPSVRTQVVHLSGGQRQAIELGRFVHWGGRLVLLDEPFAALGVRQISRGLELIKRVRERGIAVIVITHNLLHAFQIANRVVVLRNGQVLGIRPAAASSPEEVVRLITGELALQKS